MATNVTLNTGAKLPQVGLGTWQAKKGEVSAAVKHAIEVSGYRHIDCASNYLNEDEIGDTLTDLFKRGVVKREDLFLTSKLNNPYHHREHVKPHLQKTLKDLNVEYLDLWLMHWPVAFAYVPYDQEKRGFADDYDPNGCSKVDLSKYGGSRIDRTVTIRETWEAMEECYNAGLVKAIGISNFNSGLIHDLLTYAKVKPAVLQVELHPYLQQNQLVAYCQKEGIAVEGYSPLGTSGFKKENEPSVLQDSVLNEIGKKHNKSSAQVALRWAVQRGTVALPKSVNADRVTQNFQVFDFKLTDEEMESIKNIDKGYRFLRPFDWYGIPLFQ